MFRKKKDRRGNIEPEILASFRMRSVHCTVCEEAGPVYESDNPTAQEDAETSRDAAILKGARWDIPHRQETGHDEFDCWTVERITRKGRTS